MKRFFLILAILGIALVALPPIWYSAFPDPIPELPPAGRRVAVGNGVFVNTVDEGSGPPIVLVHGLPGTGYDWRNLTGALVDRGHRVLAYDRVGYGRSDARADGEFTEEANGRELVRFLDNEGFENATVVGWSYGGATAMEAALQDPTRIGRLVLVGSAGPGKSPEEPPAIFGLIFSKPVLAWVAAVPPVGRAIQGFMSIQAFSEQTPPEWWAPQLSANFNAPHTLESWRQEGARFAWGEPSPATIERPILVIHGDDDRLAPIDIGRTIHELAPNSDLFVVEGGSHMLPVTHADLMADRIAAFIAAP